MKPAVMRRWLLTALALVVLGAFALALLRSGPLAPIRVTVHTVAEGVVTPGLFGIGTVEAQRSYAVGPTAPGRLLSVEADVGDPVRRGQVLARLDPVDLDARVAALDASLARARNAVVAAEAQQRDARARAEVAAIEARRYDTLGERRFVSPSAVEAHRQAHTSARAGVDAAAASTAAARDDLVRLEAERAAVLAQRANLVLVAPEDGVVTARQAEPGNTVVAGQAVLQMIDPTSLWVRTRIDQHRATGLAEGLDARIELRSHAGEAHMGKVVRVELLSDPVTEERIARVRCDRAFKEGSVGEMAEVTIHLPASDRGPVIPNAALRHRNGQVGVWRLGDGGPHFVAVSTGAESLDGEVRVVSGLAVGDAVVVHAERPLADGARIRVVDALSGLTR
ncbi:efflux RND transporter periplasmic adaptor subunit [Nitrogeniibacter mangrovi]|uniref:Efflux RND transporter periplasmic adaptor subunit n=1 Tax=Nitrogeniibacter mangrovi TaxID=2016596 RepID=A0A6C1B743_9RHOO|nr:efflux RND transporter periplasmic adaptor subunit [Nitrogeniibacter mangrovi]QID19582.1 efflux RND transporter periplasmic adaptor subunit [Nitrogeniibacter mangrovi]